MGVLNCQKCINQENKIINELLLEGKEYKSRKVITSLENQDTNSSPLKISMNLPEQNINRMNDSNKEDNIKKIYFEIKNGNKDAIYDLDYNTLEIICNDSDSYQNFLDNESEKFIKIEKSENNDVEQIDEIQKILLTNENKDIDINEFINQKIKESQDAQIKEEGWNLNNNEIIQNSDNYKIIYDKNMTNYQNNFNNFSDLELSEDENCNNIKDKIIEEKEEYEYEESSFKNTKELRHNSANLSQKKNKSMEINNKKASIKSDMVKNKGNKTCIKETYDKNSINLNSNNIYKQQGGKSITSYEIDSDNANIENNFNVNNIYNSMENSEK